MFIESLFAAAALAEAVCAPSSETVGFTQLWVQDSIRRTPFEGAPVSGGRPILINMWYPADGGGEDMTQGDYFEVVEPARDHPILQPFATALKEFERETARGEVLEDAEDDAAFQRFLESPVPARRGADWKDGSFPVVVYHAGHGSSFDDNARLAECLADKGFAVLGSSFSHGDGSSLNTDTEEASLRDFDVLFRFAHDDPRLDAGRRAVVGHSGGAHAALRYVAQPSSDLDAVVLLDTTQDYYALSDDRWKRLIDDALRGAAAIDLPILFAANSQAAFALAGELDQADPWLLTTPRLSHNQFISQGIQALDLAGDESEEAAAARADYAGLIDVVAAFLIKRLHDEDAAFDALAAELSAVPASEPRLRLDHIDFDEDGNQIVGDGPVAELSPREIRVRVRNGFGDALAAEIGRLDEDAPGHPALEPELAFMLVWEKLEENDEIGARAIAAAFADAGVDVVDAYHAAADQMMRYQIYELARPNAERGARLAPDDERFAAMLAEIEENGF